jgi:hypothetical protein
LALPTLEADSDRGQTLPPPGLGTRDSVAAWLLAEAAKDGGVRRALESVAEAVRDPEPERLRIVTPPWPDRVVGSGLSQTTLSAMQARQESQRLAALAQALGTMEVSSVDPHQPRAHSLGGGGGDGAPTAAQLQFRMPRQRTERLPSHTPAPPIAVWRLDREAVAQWAASRGRVLGRLELDAALADMGGVDKDGEVDGARFEAWWSRTRAVSGAGAVAAAAAGEQGKQQEVVAAQPQSYAEHMNRRAQRSAYKFFLEKVRAEIVRDLAADAWPGGRAAQAREVAAAEERVKSPPEGHSDAQKEADKAALAELRERVAGLRRCECTDTRYLLWGGLPGVPVRVCCWRW